MLSAGRTSEKIAYSDFVSQGEPNAITKFYALKNLPTVLGTNVFKEWLKDKFSSQQFAQKVSDSRDLASLLTV